MRLQAYDIAAAVTKASPGSNAATQLRQTWDTVACFPMIRAIINAGPV